MPKLNVGQTNANVIKAFQAALAAVRTDIAQDLSAEEKYQALDNIAAVSYDTQSVTTEKQETARGNIGAASVGDISTVEEEIDVLSARVDAIASLPSGSTSGDAELMDIRVAYDGVTWPSAGDAVRGQVSNIMRDQYCTTPIFQRGSINSSGTVINRTYEIVTNNTFTVDTERVVDVADGFTGSLWVYPSGADAYRRLLKGAVIPANTNVRICIARVVPDTSETANISEFSNAIRIRPSNIYADTINSKSWAVPWERRNHTTYNDIMAGYSRIANNTAKSLGVDYSVKFRDSAYSFYVITNPSRTNSEIFIYVNDSFTLLGTQEFEVSVYVPDATKVNSIRFQANPAGFTKQSSQTIKNGWNKIRFMANGAGGWNENTAVTNVRVSVYHPSGAETKVFIGEIVQVKPQYGNLIIVADGPYYTTYTEAYPTLKNMGVPITWALDAAKLTDSELPTRELINLTDLETLAYDGISEFSFHNYNGVIMSTATAAEALEDTLNSIRFLKKNGLNPQRIWRAAWLQNACAHPELANLEVEASASYDGNAGADAYPWIDKYNIPRASVANRDNEWFNTVFDTLRRCHCTYVLYFHGVTEDSDKNITHTMLNYFVNKISEALTAGYLNPTTYNRLVSYYSVEN